MSAKTESGSCSGTSCQSLFGHGTLLRGSGTTEAGGVLRQIMGPAREPPVGRCPIIGPCSVVQRPQELGGPNSKVWGPSELCLLRQIAGPARAPPIYRHLLSIGAQSWDLAPWSRDHRSWGSAKADSGSCAGTSSRSVPGHETLLHGTRLRGPGTIRVMSAKTESGSCSGTSCQSLFGHGTLLRGSGTTEVGGVLRQIMGPAREPPVGRCPIIGPCSVVQRPQELGGPNSKVWGPSELCLLRQIAGPARAPPIYWHLLSIGAQSWDL
ncbi:hypothetical protein TIFTF001_017759, partial [Ficus carica]